MKYILFNPLSRNGHNLEQIKEKYLNDENAVASSVLDKEQYYNILNGLTKEDTLILIGGDGTLNHFVNDTKNIELPCEILFNASGTGNDFYTDVKNENDLELICINQYIKALPKVIVNDKEYLFVNGVGYGIDGYCCEVGDKLQKESDKPVNYTSIAIKGLLVHYKPPKAKVTVDGVTKEYKKVWLAPAMKGRFYGGGMKVAPSQNRLASDNSVTSVVMHKSGKLRTLMVFPSIFKGEHIKHKKIVDITKGHHIIVEFNKPMALQIDGETILDVTKYEVIA